MRGRGHLCEYSLGTLGIITRAIHKYIFKQPEGHLGIVFIGLLEDMVYLRLSLVGWLFGA